MKIQLRFKWQDMWVGLFHAKGTQYDGGMYLSLLPMLPIEIRWRPPPRNAGFVVPLSKIPDTCCSEPLRQQYFTLEKSDTGETGCFIYICLKCGRTWRQGSSRHSFIYGENTNIGKNRP